MTWRPASEKPPRVGLYNIALHNCGEFTGDLAWWSESGEWVLLQELMPGVEISHWQPFPELP